MGRSDVKVKGEWQAGKWVRETLDWLKTILAALGIVLILHFFVFNLSTVEGHSMEPTLEDQEWLFVNKIAYLFVSPKLGDVVVLKDPEADGNGKASYLVKRIVGLPGDTIEVRNHELYRNGVHIVEPYTDTAIEGVDYGPYVVQEGTYFLMGDNRYAHASRDSRIFGSVPKSAFKGRADLILWPITKMNFL